MKILDEKNIAKIYEKILKKIRESFAETAEIFWITIRINFIICFYFIHFSRLNSILIILFWENTGSASKNYQIFKISNHSRER